MTTSDTNTQTDPQGPRTKGGGDGDAKSATPKSQPGKQVENSPAPEDAAEPHPNRKSPLPYA